MFKLSALPWLAGFGLLLAALVHAQPATAPARAPAPTASTPSRPDPLNPQAQVPPLVHQSALGNYRAAAEAKVGSWREANDTVARIGGWRAYAREASQPGPASGAAAASPSPAAPATPATPVLPAVPAAPAASAPAGVGAQGARGAHGAHGSHGTQVAPATAKP